MHEGHRKRMLQRLERGEELQDHELLEILLFNAIPRKNTNPIAHELLTAFPSLGELFRADYEKLLDVEGVGPETAAYLRCIGILCERMRNKEADDLPAVFSAGTFSGFLRDRYASLRQEVIEIFCVDAQGRIRSSKRFTQSLPGRAAAEPKEITDLFSARKPDGVVIAHNHPDAPARPSAEDDRFTAQMQLLCSANNIRLYDHIIVGRDGAYSYFLVGRMEEIRRNFNIKTIVGEKLYRG